jgi:transcription elongation factor GreA
MLTEVVILDESGGKPGEVRMGSRVTVREEGYNETETFMVVGPAEADPMSGKISNVSPLGQALMGKRSGQSVKVHAPGGLSTFKIVRVD